MTSKRKAPSPKLGRKTIASSGEAMHMRHVRMVDALWEKAGALGESVGGASEWIRMQIEAAPWPRKK